jgi:hypothetical protein
MPLEFYRAMTELAIKEEEAERARQMPFNEDGNSSNQPA